ncbi:MAG TPA: hypothetical protein VFR62_04870, partial [Gemmatimonadales bacterium]|nr:hypothetical protein [Gemmatimonadales bacterium]
MLLAVTLSSVAPDDVREQPAQPRPRVVQMMYLQPKAEPPKPKPPPPVQPRRPPPPPTPPVAQPRPRTADVPAPAKTTEKAPEHDEPAGSSPQPANRRELATAEREDAMVTEARRLFGP